MKENSNFEEEEINRLSANKMQDFFNIVGNNNENKKNETDKKDEEKKENNDNNKDEENALFNLKDSIYKSIYEQPPQENNKKEEKKEEKKEYKSKISIERKNNLVNYKRSPTNKGDELSYIEPVHLFIDDNNKRLSEIIIQNYECKFIFDEEVQKEFINLVHFSAKYFEFPIFYVYKGSYDQSSNITIVTLKDYRSFKIKSSNNRIYNKLCQPPLNKNEYYKYAQLYKQSQDKKNIKYEKDGWKIYDPICEYIRQEVPFSNELFCFSDLNKDYSLCETYPKILVIPKKFDNENFKEIAKSRMKNRFPILSYHYHHNNINNKNPEHKISSYLYRCAQINRGGIIFKNKNVEIEYMNQITNMENNNKGFIIFDCRPEINAKANALKGAGVEQKKDYNNCKELIFGCIENIHCVRNSLKTAQRKAYYGNENISKGKVSFDIKNSNMSNFLSKFESSKWLNYLSDLLLGSILVSKKLLSNINVLVHCSDGWDRTSQICSLVQMILDPYFRTMEGFAVLVEKEWISFGHQFASRNGCDIGKNKNHERSPIFTQFLHAVYQMLMQYSTAFEFNSNFLLFLTEEIYSNKYGTFLFNSEREKMNNKAEETMVSIWSDIFNEKNKYLNDLYNPIDGPIDIRGEVKYLSIWNDFFFKFDKVGMAWDDVFFMDKERYENKIKEERTKSIIDLLKIIKNTGNEELMKDNKIYKLYQDELNKNH